MGPAAYCLTCLHCKFWLHALLCVLSKENTPCEEGSMVGLLN